MKMKLEDYLLISNKWIDNRIAKLRDLYDLYSTNSSLFQACNFIQAKISLLETIKKEQLIPSKQLAEKCFDEGVKLISENVEEYNNQYTSINLEKQNLILTENPPFFIHAVSGWAFHKTY